MTFINDDWRKYENYWMISGWHLGMVLVKVWWRENHFDARIWSMCTCLVALMATQAG